LTNLLQYDIVTKKMNHRTASTRIARIKPPRRRRASHGQWVEPAKAVYDLVGKDWNVSDATREVVKTFKFSDKAHAFKGVRAAYYVLCNRIGAPIGFDI